MNACRVHDRVHGEIELPPLAAAIASTPEFYRLDGIRQLGGCAFVYPAATHTRREHSMGVCHLAGRLAKGLAQRYPDRIHPDDVLCAQVAGLVHDLGHGPFSHLFEDYVRAHIDVAWSHEDMSLVMLDAILEAHPEIVWADHFETPAEHNLAFVKLLVRGLAPGELWPAAAVGRSEAKRFLLEIVHNRTSGVDVDKLDYLARDALAVFGATRAVPFDRLLGAARLVDATTIAYDEGVAFEMAELFALRARLHRQVYQHRAVGVVEALLSRLLGALDACLPPGQNLAAAIRNPDTFAFLTDAWVLQRPYATDPLLASAREAWQSLFRRPWRKRVPVTACLCTLPKCTSCGAPTHITDAFCTRCGAWTHDRAAVPSLPDGLLVPPECAITSADATAELRARSRVADLFVHVSSVHCGAETVALDPQGRRWLEYDPLGCIVFCARDGSRVRMRPAAFHVPEVRHVRTAHCYLAPDVDAVTLAEVTRLFGEWARERGQVVEEG